MHCVEIPELVTPLINGRVGKIKLRPPPEILETARAHVSFGMGGADRLRGCGNRAAHVAVTNTLTRVCLLDMFRMQRRLAEDTPTRATLVFLRVLDERTYNYELSLAPFSTFPKPKGTPRTELWLRSLKRHP